MDCRCSTMAASLTSLVGPAIITFRADHLLSGVLGHDEEGGGGKTTQGGASLSHTLPRGLGVTEGVTRTKKVRRLHRTWVPSSRKINTESSVCKHWAKECFSRFSANSGEVIFDSGCYQASAEKVQHLNRLDRRPGGRSYPRRNQN